MTSKWIMVLIGLFHIEAVMSAPLVFLPQSVMPAHAHQEAVLQEQLVALQPPLDWLLRSPLRLNTPLFIPNTITPLIKTNSKTKPINGLETQESTKETKDQDETNSEINGDEDSIVIEADNDMKGPQQQRVTYFLANGQRFYVGSIIGAIPFLPIEVNVPDSIAWIWNGISGIISGLGQRWPFRPRPETPRPLNEELFKMIYNQEMNVRNQMLMPNMRIPLNQMIMPYGNDMTMPLPVVILVPFGAPEHRGTNEVF